jgi:Protein of unknown function (DUF4038)/Putative collagen-binding domain of a collagenase/Bacterial Ig-like domain (group 2)
VRFVSALTWSFRAGLFLALFSCNTCSSSGGGSEPATLTGLSVTPASATVAVNLSRQLLATAAYSDNSTANKTSQAVWSSTAPGVATVTAGVVTGVSAGDASIIASLGVIADTAQVTITATQPPLAGLTVTPNPVTIAVGGTRALAATANYSDGSFATVTTQASWTSTAPGVATVNAGLVSAVAAGTAGIGAAFGTFADTSQVTVTATGPSGYVYPLKVGPTSRYLVDQNGKPFFLVGDAAWSLIAQLSYQNAETYLAARQGLGFNLVMVNLLEHEFATNAPANIAGVSPFTGTDFATPNEAYFAHADSILQSAAQKGIVVLLAPAYVGYGCGSQGWASELQAASTATLTAYGQYLGARYKNYDNLIWLIGGDADPGSCGVTSKLQALVDGILQSDTRHVFTAHNAPESSAVSQWSGATWLSVNNVYTYSTTLYQKDLSAYHGSPTMPFFLIESTYEGEGASAQELRAQSYWTVLSGGFGHVFGNCPIWHFGSPSGSQFCSSTNWQGQLSSQGSRNMQYLKKLFTARRWHLLVPDEANTAVTGGLGSGTDYTTAAVASDGSSIIAYLPSSRTVTVNGSGLGSSMTAWWYNPATGVSTSGGTYPTTVTHDFIPPGNGDWVLVIDNASLNLPAP